jgi:hypothetical protein
MADALSIDSVFEKNANLMLPEILDKVTKRDVVIDIFDKGVWPAGMGDSLDTLTIERSLADGATEAGDDWVAVCPPAGGLPQNTPLNTTPPVNTLTTGQTRRPMSLYWKALESQLIQLDLIRGTFELNQQLDLTERQFVTGLRRELWKRFLYAYYTSSGNCINASLANSSDLTSAQPGAFPLGYLPDIQLEQGFLDAIWDEMENSTQGDGSIGVSKSTNASVYMLLTEPLTSRGLITNTANIRQDVQYATMGDGVVSAPLLAPLGVDGQRIYGNFIHKTFKEMPRYNYVPGSGYVRVPFWVKQLSTANSGASARSQGYSWVPNPAYYAASYTTSYIINTKVFKWLVPGMLNSPGGDASFETPDYFPNGIKWLNVQNVDKNSTAYNPDKTIGFYRAVIAAAIQPEFPEYGWCILHKKYVPPYGSTYTGYSYGT